MEVTIDVRYLNQQEFDVLNQIQINAGVRKEADRQKVVKKDIETEPTEKPKRKYTKRVYTPRKRKRKMAFLTEKDVTEIYKLNKKGFKPSEIAKRVGLKTKTVAGVVYRLEVKPSKTMEKVIRKNK